MKKYIFTIISISVILGLILLGAYYRGENILSRVIPVGENSDIQKIKNSTNIFEMFGTSTRSYHKIGTGHAGKKSWFTTPKDGAGFLTYGPYTQLNSGYYQAIFDLQIYDETLNSDEIIRIEVYDPFNVKKIAEKIITRDEFRTSLKKQNFVLPFEIEEPQILEFRVYSFGKSYVEHLKTTVVRVDNPIFTGSDPLLTHQIGNVDGSSWKAQASDGTGYITRGPYLQHLLADVHTASFQLGIDSLTGAVQGDDDIVADLEVFDTITQTIIKKRIIKRSHFYEANKPQDFDVEFEIPAETTLELRVKVFGKADIIHHKTQLYSDKVTMNDIWYQKAHFDLYDIKVFASSREEFPELFDPTSPLTRTKANEPSTAPIVTLDGVWYTLNRQTLPSVNPTCSKLAMRTVIRKSVDQGRTWSQPIAIEPPATQENLCGGTDGSLFFDIETGIWHFIASCSSKAFEWGNCHYTRDNISPMGLFTPNPQNPVIRGGDLFKKLCTEMGENCPALLKPNPNNDGKPAKNRLGMLDEGTPQITEKRDGYFYMTYHGAHFQNNGIVQGIRAVARTRDFINWEVTGKPGSGLPNDIMLSNLDCKWNPDGQIGAGVQIRSGGFNYVLSECPDKTITMMSGEAQEWAQGLNRHPQYAKTGTWGAYSQNPFVKSSDPLTKENTPRLAYGKLFRDRGTIYMAELGKWVKGFPYGMPLYIYKIAPGKGPVNYQVPGTDTLEDTSNILQD